MRGEEYKVESYKAVIDLADQRKLNPKVMEGRFKQ